MIVRENQRFTANRMNAQVRAHPVDHAPIITAPSVVVDIIREAISSVAASEARPQSSASPNEVST
jgi:hypothetical protein